jgi:hypothetical protein
MITKRQQLHDHQTRARTHSTTRHRSHTVTNPRDPLFSDRNLRIGRSSTVHAVIWVDWINGLTLPGPACGQGWSGLGATGELLTTGLPATCARCRRLTRDSSDDSPTARELALFPLSHRDRGMGDDVGRSGKSVQDRDGRRDVEAARVVAGKITNDYPLVTYLARHASPCRPGTPGAGARTVEGRIPKRGQRRPYKGEYQHPSQGRVVRIAKGDEFGALIEARQLARRGAEVWVFYLDPDSNERTELAYHVAEDPPPDDRDDSP